MVRYENVPHFCFVCGRIGHAERECPEEDAREGGPKFGKTLRCSPQKWDVGKRFTIPAGEQRAKRGLNFSGDQREKVMAEANSSNRSPMENRGSVQRRGRDVRQEAVVAALAKGVASLSVDDSKSNFNEVLEGGSKQRVSGLDSYAGSSDVSDSL